MEMFNPPHPGETIKELYMNDYIADHIVHLTLGAAATVGGTTRSAAGGAAAGLVLEALIGVELLLGRGEHELLAALAASEGLVFKHGNDLLSIVCPTDVCPN